MGCCGQKKRNKLVSAGIKSARSKSVKTVKMSGKQLVQNLSSKNKCPKCKSAMRVVRNARTSAVTNRVCSNARCRHRSQ